MKSFSSLSLVGLFCLMACSSSQSGDLAANGVTGRAPASQVQRLSSDEQVFLVKINQLRAQNGLAELALDPVLQKSSAAHSEYMNSIDYLTHDEPPPNLASWDRIANAGGDFNYTGENIACGNASGDKTFTQWYNSPGHLANMLSPNFKYIGIARAGSDAEALSKNCPYFWTTDFGG